MASSPELTYDEVIEAGRPAVCTTMADPEDAAGHGVYREWRCERGRTWLIHRDDTHNLLDAPRRARGDPVERVAPQGGLRLPVLHRARARVRTPSGR